MANFVELWVYLSQAPLFGQDPGPVGAEPREPAILWGT